jgi:hypothetical protein
MLLRRQNRKQVKEQSKNKLSHDAESFQERGQNALQETEQEPGEGTE